MKLAGCLLCGVLLVGGCAGRVPEPRTPTMVRNFHGTLVPGYYVSPSAYQHYIQAQLYSNDGRSEEAAEELRQALAADGASAYLRTRLAEELLTLGRVDEAREEVDAALHLDPESPDAYVDLAKVKLRLADEPGAEQALERAIAIDPTCEDAYVSLVELYRERGDDVRALQSWRALAEHVPTSAPAHEALGRDALARGELAPAERELRRALELEPGMEDARVELGRLLQGEGRFDDAAGQLEEAYERSGDNKIAEMIVRLDLEAGKNADARELVDRLDDEGGTPERRLLVGWLYITVGQPKRARAIAEEVLRGHNSPGAHLLAGDALRALGHTDAALAELRKVPPAAIQFAGAQTRIAGLLRDNGRFGEAVAELGRALLAVAGQPSGEGVADALNDTLARVHERAGDRTLAIKVLEEALARRPQSEALALALGQAYQRAGQWERAVQTVRKVLARDPESAPALNFIGFVLADHGVKLDEARRLIERALAIRPADGGIVDSLGWLEVREGRLDDAEQLLVRADRLSPEEPEILEHLGELYVKKSDRGRALEAYRRALAHDPDEAARRSLEERILLLETGRLGSR
ncbi:MAG TPA: tetratricopeptide repeat protein [Polyangia bacterium]